MATLSRRDVLRSGALALAAFRLRPARTQSGTVRRHHLVIVRLHGGADGLSMIAPWRDPAYRQARPTIALAPPGRSEHAAIDLDGTFGLHPRLSPVLPLFTGRVLDIVPACGLATVTRSHLVDAEALDRVLAMVGASPAPPIGGRSRPLAAALAELARDLRRGAAPAVSVVHSYGWDHHAGQHPAEGPQATALDDLARGLAAFASALGPRLAHTGLVTVSEFGRSIAENGHGGTEHGHATSVFVLGGPARRGRILGDWPGLDGDDVVRPTVLLGDVFA